MDQKTWIISERFNKLEKVDIRLESPQNSSQNMYPSCNISAIKLIVSLIV